MRPTPVPPPGAATLLWSKTTHVALGESVLATPAWPLTAGSIRRVTVRSSDATFEIVELVDNSGTKLEPAPPSQGDAAMVSAQGTQFRIRELHRKSIAGSHFRIVELVDDSAQPAPTSPVQASPGGMQQQFLGTIPSVQPRRASVAVVLEQPHRDLVLTVEDWSPAT